MNFEVIVTCAVTGAGDTVGRHPGVPVTPEQIAQAAIDAAKAGVKRGDFNTAKKPAAAAPMKVAKADTAGVGGPIVSMTPRRDTGGGDVPQPVVTFRPLGASAPQPTQGTGVSSDQVLEFLQFVEGQKNQTVSQLLDKVLRKSRLMTGAEAGTIFIARHRGRSHWLEPASIQNDAVRVKRADFIVPTGLGRAVTYRHLDSIVRAIRMGWVPPRRHPSAMIV